jgi:protease I
MFLQRISILSVLFTLVLAGCITSEQQKLQQQKPLKAPEKEIVSGEKMTKKVLFIIAPENFRDEELLKPKKKLEAAGFETEIASIKTGKAVGMLGTEVEVEKVVYDLNPEDYDAIVLVGGIGAKVFFTDEKVQEFLVKAYEKGKIVAAICISPVTLAKAGLLKGKKATVWHTEAKTIESYGAKYTGSDVEVDGRIVTASGPEAAEKFGETLVKLLSS